MLEIILVIYLSKKIGKMVEAKGQKKVGMFLCSSCCGSLGNL